MCYFPRMFSCWGSDAVLLFVSQMAGILLLCGTLMLIGFGRIYIDAETKKPIEFELPIFGKIQTQSPVIFTLVIAALLVIYPLTRPRVDLLTLKGNVQTSGDPVTVLVVGSPYLQGTYDATTPFTLPVPLIKDERYRVKYEVGKKIITEKEPKSTSDGLEVDPFVWNPPQSNTSPGQTAIPQGSPVTNEYLQKLGIN